MSFLPAPKHKYAVFETDDAPSDTNKYKSVVIPALGHRGGYIPSSVEDFGDGGAFPEIHVVQYPLNMGKPGSKSTAVIAVDVDEKGEVKYDAIIKQGGNRNKIVQSSIQDIKEKEGDKDALAMPAVDEERATAERTRLALEMLLDSKIKKVKPTTISGLRTEATSDAPTYIRYTPNQNAPGVDGTAGKERVIRMVEAQVDILEPAKHKFKKVPRGPPSPPAPVLHSPPRKLTVADQASWKVPPCISNWKNARGYTIPLDKRLAADGRGLQETTINNKFASLTEALYVVERKAAEDIRIRNQVRKQVALRDKEDSERELREMAMRARMERSGAMLGSDRANAEFEAPDDTRDYYRRTAPEEAEVPGAFALGLATSISASASASAPSIEDRRLLEQRGESDAERVAREQREQLRVERRKEREREARLLDSGRGSRGDKQDRDAGRDISEKIALGVLKGGGSAQLTGEGMFDSRLFNQSSGMDAGFGGDDEYNTYSKPLFARAEVANSIYRPKGGGNSDSDVYGDADAQLAKLQASTTKFKADKGFRGTEDYAQAGPRTEPVQFEGGNSSSSGSSGSRDERESRRRRYDDSEKEGVNNNNNDNSDGNGNDSRDLYKRTRY